MIRITNIVWANPLSFDSYLPTAQHLGFSIDEDATEQFLYDAYGYEVASFQFERIQNCSHQ